MNDRTGTERKKTKTWLKSMRKLRLLLTLTVVPVFHFLAAAGEFAVEPERFRFDGTSVGPRRKDKSQIRQVQTAPGMPHCGCRSNLSKRKSSFGSPAAWRSFAGLRGSKGGR